jgi:hypothetical protein
MKTPLLLATAAALLGACATTDRVAMVEDGFERGSLGVAAISRGDWHAAERPSRRAAWTRAIRRG